MAHRVDGNAHVATAFAFVTVISCLRATLTRQLQIRPSRITALGGRWRPGATRTIMRRSPVVASKQPARSHCWICSYTASRRRVRRLQPTQCACMGQPAQRVVKLAQLKLPLRCIFLRQREIRHDETPFFVRYVTRAGPAFFHLLWTLAPMNSA